MEIALVNGERTRALPGLVGQCPACNQTTLAKCGSQLAWHWAHKGKRHCDPWWENETEWHRNWKSYFPERMHEVVRFDQSTGEKHIADLMTDREMVIEIQHSAMSFEELRSREEFYKKMVWIVDGKPFSNQFEVKPEPLPHPQSPLLEDVVFSGNCGRAFWLRSENEAKSTMVQIHNAEKIADQILEQYRGHHFFTWKRPRAIWLQASSPVLIDFGGHELYRIYEYPTNQHSVQRVSKRAFIEKNGGFYTPQTIGTPNSLFR